MRRCLPLLLLAVSAALPARAQSPAPQPGRVALVIGNAAYRALPPLPACQASAALVAAGLRRAGWSVTDLRDPSNGQMGAAIGTLGDALAGPTPPPIPAAFVYECGYAAAYERRLFLLPASATLARDTDVLTEGLVAPALTGPVARSAAPAALIAVDLVALPGAAAPIAPETAQLRTRAPRTGILAAGDPAASPAAPTPLALALAAALDQPSLTVADLQAAVQRALADKPGLDLSVQAPTEAAWLQGEPPPPVTAELVPSSPEPASIPAAPPTPILPTQAPSEPAPAAPTSPAPPPASSPQTAEPTPPLANPDAPAMIGDLDRRRIQLALQRLGYYAGRVDGLLGAETLAAIRRYQHELGAPMTGSLTRSQVASLLAQP